MLRRLRALAALFVLLVVAVACLVRSDDPLPRLAPSGAERMLAADQGGAAHPTMFLSPDAWVHMPWWHAEDALRIDWPIYIVLADDGEACLVDGGEWAVAMPSKPFACQTGWRQPRPRY